LWHVFTRITTFNLVVRGKMGVNGLNWDEDSSCHKWGQGGNGGKSIGRNLSAKESGREDEGEHRLRNPDFQSKES